MIFILTLSQVIFNGLLPIPMSKVLLRRSDVAYGSGKQCHCAMPVCEDFFFAGLGTVAVCVGGLVSVGLQSLISKSVLCANQHKV